MKEYLGELIKKYEILCKTLQEVEEDLKGLSKKRNRRKVKYYLNSLKDKYGILRQVLKDRKSHLLRAQSYVAEPIKGLYETKMLDNMIKLYEKLKEQDKQSDLTSDVIILEAEILRDGFLKKVLNTILNLWNNLVSCFSANTNEPTQSFEYKESLKGVKTVDVEKSHLKDKNNPKEHDEKLEDPSVKQNVRSTGKHQSLI